ncbi:MULTISPECIES: DNA gyrase subunit A [unclassified Microbacterium]|uniref:DNA gyrase subunit A n=1 Tax=unclassified Microbacterium TaxID=2609290 RepID=UPI0012FB234F|nr:DNA gyrase subunit A [Microbacterium sp. MAH-37]
MSDLQVLRARHDVIAALLVAAENAEHVMRICSSAAPDAADELVRTFGVSDLQAQAILEMQLRRFAPEAAAAMRAELVEVSRRISEIEAR